MMHALILTKNGLGCILGDFFTNSFGHPGMCLHSTSKRDCVNLSTDISATADLT
jgi:hypothetical protein